MPFVVKHGVAAGSLAKAAFAAGRATRPRSTAVPRLARAGVPAAPRPRPRAIQEAGTPRDTGVDQDTRRQVSTAISEAESSGIYRPEQIEQMKIFAKFGDTKAIRSILRDLPTREATTARQRELRDQMTGLQAATQEAMGGLQQRRSALDQKLKQMEKDAGGAEVLEDLARPDNPNAKLIAGGEGRRYVELRTQRDTLDQRISGVQATSKEMQRQLGYGIFIHDQMKMKTHATEAIAKAQRQEALDLGNLSPRARVAIDVIRKQIKFRKDRVQDEIELIQKDMGQNKGEDADDWVTRVERSRGHISLLEQQIVAWDAREQQEIASLMSNENVGKTGDQTGPSKVVFHEGRRLTFKRFDPDGVAVYED